MVILMNIRFKSYTFLFNVRREKERQRMKSQTDVMPLLAAIVQNLCSGSAVAA